MLDNRSPLWFIIIPVTWATISTKINQPERRSTAANITERPRHHDMGAARSRWKCCCVSPTLSKQVAKKHIPSDAFMTFQHWKCIQLFFKKLMIIGQCQIKGYRALLCVQCSHTFWQSKFPWHIFQGDTSSKDHPTIAAQLFEEADKPRKFHPAECAKIYNKCAYTYKQMIIIFYQDAEQPTTAQTEP